MNSMLHKLDKQFFFEVELNWLVNERTVIQSRDVKGVIHAAIPKQFGGNGKDWSPEHLFLSSICSCYMCTYVCFAKKMNFNICRMECSAIGQTERVDEKYKFTYINLYPEIYIAEESILGKANLAAEKTQRYCLVSNSIDASIIYHPELLIESAR